MMEEISLAQINLGRRQIAHENFTRWLSRRNRLYIVCLQEPRINQRGLSQLDRRYEIFWARKNNKERPHAAIVVPKVYNAIMLTQYSEEFCNVTFIARWELVIISLYCHIKKDIDKVMEKVREVINRYNRVIVCLDSNAHASQWGILGDTRKDDRRGKQLMKFIEKERLYVCNEWQTMGTFICRNKGETGIDLTITTKEGYKRVRNWRVVENTFSSDHRVIKFRYMLIGEEVERYKEQRSRNYRPPIIYEVDLELSNIFKEKVRHREEAKSIKGLEKIVKEHSREIRQSVKKYVNWKEKRRIKVNREGKRGEEKPWWGKEINEIYERLKIVRRRYERYQKMDDKEEYWEIRRQFQKKMQKEKYESWKKYVTSVNDPWQSLMRVLRSKDVGRGKTRTVKGESGRFTETPGETVEELKDKFFPSEVAYSEEHRRIKAKVDKYLIENKKVKVEEEEEIKTYEIIAKLSEIEKRSAPGLDQVTNGIIKYLIIEQGHGRTYVNMFNSSLKLGYVPREWKRAKIVLIPKPGVELDTVKVFRPISLTAMGIKLMERVLIDRLVLAIERSGKMALRQHAYRKGSSTYTALYEMTRYIEDAKREKNVCVVVFLDISGAFDRAWHVGIINGMIEMGVPAYLIRWISEYLKDREAVIEYAGEEKVYKLESGCPQGGVLSPILWNIFFNSMLTIRFRKDGHYGNDKIRLIGYADDAAVICRARTGRSAAMAVNRYLERIQQWAIENRVEFNYKKVACMRIGREIEKDDIEIKFGGHNIDEVREYRYLGVIIDSKVSWQPHINSVLEKCRKVFWMIKPVVGDVWGLRMDLVRTIIKVVICPVMFYGVSVWGWKANRKYNENRFNKILRDCCKMGIRSMKTVSSEVLYAYMGIENFKRMLWYNVRRIIMTQYYMEKTPREKYYEKKGRFACVKNMDHMFYLVKQGLEELKGKIRWPKLYGEEREEVSKKVEGDIRSRKDAIEEGKNIEGWVIYTDASRSSYGGGWAAIVMEEGVTKFSKMGRSSRNEVITLETRGVKLGLELCNRINSNRIKIRTDCKSVVEKAMNRNSDEEDIREIQGKIEKLWKEENKEIIIQWCPGHEGIEGNEKAHQMARKAIDEGEKEDEMMQIRDLKVRLKEIREDEAERRWREGKYQKPRRFFKSRKAIKKFLDKKPSIATIQLSTGHCVLNDYLSRVIKVRDSGECKCGEAIETIDHYLYECKIYKKEREIVWKKGVEEVKREEYNHMQEIDQYIRLTKRFKLEFFKRDIQTTVLGKEEEQINSTEENEVQKDKEQRVCDLKRKRKLESRRIVEGRKKGRRKEGKIEESDYDNHGGQKREVKQLGPKRRGRRLKMGRWKLKNRMAGNRKEHKIKLDSKRKGRKIKSRSLRIKEDSMLGGNKKDGQARETRGEKRKGGWKEEEEEIQEEIRKRTKKKKKEK